MSKLRNHGTLCTLVLFAAVAVFSGMANMGSLNLWKSIVGLSFTGDKELFIADGGDPYPKPPTPPLPPVVAS